MASAKKWMKLAQRAAKIGMNDEHIAVDRLNNRESVILFKYDGKSEIVVNLLIATTSVTFIDMACIGGDDYGFFKSHLEEKEQ